MSAGVRSMEFNRSGTLVWVGDEKGCIYSFGFHVESGRLQEAKCMVIEGDKPVTSISMSPEVSNPILLVNVAKDRLFLYWVTDNEGGLKLKNSFPIAHKSYDIRSSFCLLTSSMNGYASFASSSEDMVVYIFIFESAEKPHVKKLYGHSAPVLDVCCNYDETLMASCDVKGNVMVWRRASTKAQDDQ